MRQRNKLGKFTPYVIGACMLTFIVACGADDDDDSSSRRRPQQQEEQTDEGRYRVNLIPLNTQVGNTVSGTADITIQGDNVEVSVDVTGAPLGTHSQHIHTGNACATIANDTNGDGFVDAVEAAPVSGDILVPLDGDLAAQMLGENNFPSGANYNYSESTSFALMLADLRAPDLDTGDNVVKLGDGDNLNLAGRVIEIHGVPSNTNLPASVQSDDDGQTPEATLPIACGVIERVSGGTTGGTGGTTGGTGGTTGGTGGTTGGTGGTTGGTGGTTGGTGGTTGGTGGTTGGTGGTTGGTGGTTGGIVR